MQSLHLLHASDPQCCFIVQVISLCSTTYVRYVALPAVAAAFDRYLLPVGPTAANPLHAVAVGECQIFKQNGRAKSCNCHKFSCFQASVVCSFVHKC